MGRAVDAILPERDRFKVAERRRQEGAGRPPHEGLAMHPVLDQGLDGDHLQLVTTWQT